MKKKNISFGQIIRRFHAGEFESCYTLLGNEIFLQDYFINELDKYFLKDHGEKIFFNMDNDNEEKLFKELYSVSLFEEKRIIVVREIKKIRSNRGRKEILEYINAPNINTLIVFLSQEYDFKNNFINLLSKKSLLIDVRSPFNNKMIEWVKFILKKRNIKFTNLIIDHYINLYGDSISHVLNEIEKDLLFFNKNILSDDIINREDISDRTFHLWQLQDSIGDKNLLVSLRVFKSFKENGFRIQQIVNNAVNLFQQLLFFKMGEYSFQGYTGINKIIKSRLEKYSRGYTIKEIKNVLLELRKIDVLSKTTFFNDLIFFESMLIKICKGYYA